MASPLHVSAFILISSILFLYIVLPEKPMKKYPTFYDHPPKRVRFLALGELRLLPEDVIRSEKLFSCLRTSLPSSHKDFLDNYGKLMSEKLVMTTDLSGVQSLVSEFLIFYLDDIVGNRRVAIPGEDFQRVVKLVSDTCFVCYGQVS